MSKHDNDHDDVPIAFAEPEGRTRIPHPINQPNWQYNNNPRASKAGIILNWVGLIPYLLFTGMLAYIAFKLPPEFSWIAWIAVVLLAFFSYRLYDFYLASRDKRDNPEDSSLSREKHTERKIKYPKHRKDYR